MKIEISKDTLAKWSADLRASESGRLAVADEIDKLTSPRRPTKRLPTERLPPVLTRAFYQERHMKIKKYIVKHPKKPHWEIARMFEVNQARVFEAAKELQSERRDRLIPDKQPSSPTL